MKFLTDDRYGDIQRTRSKRSDEGGRENRKHDGPPLRADDSGFVVHKDIISSPQPLRQYSAAAFVLHLTKQAVKRILNNKDWYDSY
jgi:hypothetical protein